MVSGGQSAVVLPDHGCKLIGAVYADMAGYSRLIGLEALLHSGPYTPPPTG
jgi:hypothetical protein